MLMLSVGLDNNIVCYDVREKEALRSYPTKYCLSALDLMPDGLTLAVGSNRGKIIIFDLRKANAPVKCFDAHKTQVQKLAFQKCSSKRCVGVWSSSLLLLVQHAVGGVTRRSSPRYGCPEVSS